MLKKRRALETVSVSRDERHQQTAISSADGARILKSLDEDKEKYDNNSNRSNTFLRDFAKAIGAGHHGSLSQQGLRITRTWMASGFVRSV